MVLWELTLATAYFLGLKRTYRLVLKIQRRLISPKYSKIRQFLHRRTRAVFDVALKVHRNIQQRDLEVGRSVGTRILRWLDRMKPSANIRGAPEEKLPGQNNGNRNTTKQSTTTSNHQKRNTWPKPVPGISMRSTTHYRQLWTPSYGRVGSEGVIRRDIMLWMQTNL
uniref:Uncharacterized protein n=1 Tax=Opuntia streptacantha TaxID=393608 RepID=A0A7C8ZBH1_OPUST